MTLSLQLSRQDVRDYLAANFSQTALEGSVPNYTQLHRENGVIAPYIVYNFSDIGQGFSTSIIGPRGDTYIQAFNVYAIASTIKATNDIYLKALDKFLGFSPAYSSMISKRPGGGTFVISTDNGAGQAFVTVASFQFTTELLNIN